jgi:predicted dehydrogenase
VAQGDYDFQVPMSYRYGDITSPFINFNEPLELENRAFIDAIRTGSAERADALAGLRVVMVMEAAQRSLADGGRPIDLSDVMVDHDLMSALSGDRSGAAAQAASPENGSGS